MKTIGTEPVTPHLTYNRTTGNADGFKEGLTKREYFAAMSMQGILAKHGLPDEWTNETILNQLSSPAFASVAAADALIKVLNENS